MGGSIDEFLKFVPEGRTTRTASGGHDGLVADDGGVAIRPSVSGLKWIDAPSGLSNGTVFRLTTTSLELLQVVEAEAAAAAETTGDDEEGGDSSSSSSSPAARIISSFPLSVPGVNITSSSDGRLVAVACIDGSIRIYNATNEGVSERSVIPNCHSHTSRDVFSSPSKDRTNAALLSGPITTMAFNNNVDTPQRSSSSSSNSYRLLVVDARMGVAVYDAAQQQSTPENLLLQSQPTTTTAATTENVSCAAWNPSNTKISTTENSTTVSSSTYIVLGRFDGSVELVRLKEEKNVGGNNRLEFEAVASLGKPAVPEDGGGDYCCTHLNWMPDDTIVVGLCHVTPSEDEDDDDDEDEDDTAEHVACLCTTILSPEITAPTATSTSSIHWENHEDVVPFFSVPKHGRHAFFTAFVDAVPNHQLILVAANVGSDVAVLTRGDDDGGDAAWHLAELDDGAGATTPTDDDDEFTFPTGLTTVQLPSSAAFRLLVEATDGSTSSFGVVNTNDDGYFTAPIRGSVQPLPSVPVESTSTTIGNETDAVVVENKTVVNESNIGSASTSFSFGTGSVAAAPAQAPAPSFMSPSKAFGSGSGTGLSFGSSSPGTASPFAAFTPKAAAGSSNESGGIAGAPSSFGAFKPKTSGSATETSTASPFAFGGSSTMKPAQESSSAFSFGGNTATGSPFSFGTSTAATGAGVTENQTSGFSFGTASTSLDPPVASSLPKSAIPAIESSPSSKKDDAAPVLNVEARSADTQAKQDVDSGEEEEAQQERVVAEVQQNDNEVVDNSVDSDEREIIATEVSKLKGCFEKLSASTDEVDRYITADQFLDVMGALDITYDERVHGKVKNDLTDDDGKIHEKDMVDWYAKWLSGDVSCFVDDVCGLYCRFLTLTQSWNTLIIYDFSQGEDESVDNSDQVELVDEREEDESGSDSTEAKRASKVFDTFDKEKVGTLPISSLESLIDELGEGFSGDEFDEQVAILDPSNTGTVSKKAFVDWYVNLLNDADDDGSMDTDEREERAEEAQTAKENFEVIAKNDPEDKKGPYILKDQFQQLLESFGTVYCEEEHTRSLRKLVQPNGRIYQAAFVDWYVEYLFGGDESSVESSSDDGGEDDGREDDAADESNAVPSLASVFNQASGSGWKCDVCSVPNKETSDACVACGTKNPNAPTPATTSSSSRTENTSSAFSFGAPTGSSATTAASKPAFSFGAPSSSTSSENKEQTTKPSSGGFSFGAPSASSTTAALSKPSFGFGAPSSSTGEDASNQTTGAFSFGAPSTTTTASSQKPSGGFSFGVPSSTSSSSDSKEQDLKNSTTSARGYSFGAPSPSVEKVPVESPASAMKTAASSSAAAFPPMSKAAPKPFSGGMNASAPAPAPTPKAASAAFPPMSSTAPKPFGGGNVSKSPAPAPAPTPTPKAESAAFPPMSSTAPKPFGGGNVSKSPALAPAPAPKPTSAAFPPMSSTAPKPFGGGIKASAPAPTSKPAAAAFPPMSSTAPKPFGGGDVSKSPTPAPAPKPTSVAFPPMSSTAPKPFGGGIKASAPAPTPKPAAAAFPPMSSTAPKPFGGVSKSPAPAPAPKPASSAFPPISSTAPKPFGGVGKSPGPAPAHKTASAAFPPMSSTAPRPFGGVSKSPAPAAAFPPMSSNAPKPFGSTNKEPAPKLANAASVGSTSSQSPTDQTHSGDPGRSISVPHAHLSKASKQMQVLIQDMDKMNESSYAMGQKLASAILTLEQKAEGLINSTNRYREQLLTLDDVSKEMKEQRAFALSRNTDSKRQAAGARKSLGAIRSSSALSDGVCVNNLDADSEFARRNIAASAISISRRVALAKERIGTMEKLNEGNIAPLSQQIMKIYKQSKAFEDLVVPRITNKIQTNHRKLGGGASSTSGKYEFVDDEDDADVVTPASIQRARHTSRQADRTQNISCWKSIEATLPGLESVECNFDNLQPHGRARKAPHPPARLAGDGSSNLLLSRSPFRNSGPERVGLSDFPKTSIFSPPSRSRPRSAWETPSTIEQVEMKKQFTSMPVPTALPEMSLLDSAKTTLAGFSTTPEKLKAAVEASTFVPTSEAPTAARKIPASSVTTPISMSKNPTVAKLPSANETKVDSQKKAPPAPAFPPLSAVAPKNPFSSIVKDNKKKPEDSSATSAPQGGLTKTTSPSSPAPAPSSLEGMGGLGASLFSGSDQSKQSTAGGSLLSTTPAPGFSSNALAPGSTTNPSSTTSDYKSMLTSFYQKHNPAKVNDVDKHLQKYQVRNILVSFAFFRIYHSVNLAHSRLGLSLFLLSISNY